MNSDPGRSEDIESIPDPVKVEDRAIEIAQQEGRQGASEYDRIESRHEIKEPAIGDELPEDEIDENDRPDAGVAPVSSGTKIERVPLEDEDSAVEELIREGIENADENTRTHSGSNREL